MPWVWDLDRILDNNIIRLMITDINKNNKPFTNKLKKLVII